MTQHNKEAKGRLAMTSELVFIKKNIFFTLFFEYFMSLRCHVMQMITFVLSFDSKRINVFVIV